MTDINKFNEEFENIIKDCKVEEDDWYAMQSELEKKYTELAKKNIARVEKLKVCRKQKIDEIEKNIGYYIELNAQLTGQLLEIVKPYCEQNGHKDIVFSYNCLRKTGYYDYKNDDIFVIRKYSKCSICERITWEEYSTSIFPKTKIFQKNIPEEIYSNKSFVYNGKTYKEIENEINNNNSYISYLNYLKEYICELFGHQSNDYSSCDNYIRCDLCGKIMQKRTYEEKRKNPIYKGVVEKWSPLYDKMMIINKKNSLIISLPTYEEYLAMKSETCTEKDTKTLKKKI